MGFLGVAVVLILVYLSGGFRGESDRDLFEK